MKEFDAWERNYISMLREWKKENKLKEMLYETAKRLKKNRRLAKEPLVDMGKEKEHTYFDLMEEAFGGLEAEVIMEKLTK